MVVGLVTHNHTHTHELTYTQTALFYTADTAHKLFPYAAKMPTIWTHSMNL